jgi:Peptidase family M28
MLKNSNARARHHHAASRTRASNGRQVRGFGRSTHRSFAITFVLALLASAAVLVGQRAGLAHSSGTAQTANRKSLVDPLLVQHYQEMITPEDLAARLYFLASDSFEGRETASRGQKLAAEYLASQYRLMGLTPKGTNSASDPLSPSAYYQPFMVYKRAPKETRLEVTINGSAVVSSTFSSQTHDDLSYFLSGAQVNAVGGVVFAGYGIADDKLGYNDYAALAAKGVSVTDKWVMILDDEPLSDKSTSLLPTADHEPSTWTQFPNKRRALWNAGRPRGVLVVSDLSPLQSGSFESRSALASSGVRRVGALSLTQLSPFPPTFVVSSKLADQILTPSGHRIAELKRGIDQSLKPNGFSVGENIGVTATVEPSEGLPTENILALIEGSDPKLKDEVLIVSAHYDHLGINPNLKGDQIFNGAADDGSGVVACLELAQQFMKAKRDGYGPRRSILFVQFTGEEKGLLGSSQYSAQPIVPWENTVADINMDGVAGLDPKHPTGSKNYVYVFGTKELSGELVDTTKLVNRTLGTNLELTEGPRFSSDQYNFEAQLIPYVYFSTGLTEKYHQPGDEPNTIAYDHFSRVVKLVFATAWQVANQDQTTAKVDRRRLTLVGYGCPPCGFECDSQVYEHPGECPVCGMNLAPKYKIADTPVSRSAE